LNAFEFGLRSGTVRSITGLQTPAEQGGSFTIQSRNPEEEGPLDIGSSARATESAVPWFAIDADNESLFGGLLWPGSWHARVEHENGGLRATLGLPSFTTTVDGALDTPHAYVGVTDESVRSIAEMTRGFIDRAIRHGRPYSSLVTYNTWFQYGTAIDEESMNHEIDAAADLGVELFVVDAGWYKAGTDPYDFTTGIGVWEADSERFPSGLAALSDRAHERGMKFGLWVEPERVDLQTVGKTGLARDRWLAMQGGRYDPAKRNSMATSAQICLAHIEARNWIVERLTRLIDEVHPDYLKWDNNFWVNCDRSGHGHGTEDGNFMQVRGLQQVLDTIRARYPDLVIENCSGGGNRLEPSMLAYSDTAWMDDRSLSPMHVRHNLQGLSTLMPPASLLSFVFGNEWASDPDDSDLGFAFRSRMPGILGAAWRNDDLVDEARVEIRQEIAMYRGLRDSLADASLRLLSPQIDDTSFGAWDALQETSASTGFTVLFAFENPGAAPTMTVRPQGLRPATFYEVVSVDAGSLGRASGEELMLSGVQVFSSQASRAHVIELRPLPDSPPDDIRR
jgi:alpha-galactosidase